MNEFISMGRVIKKDPKAHPHDPKSIIEEHSNGLTKRELFAAMALQTLLQRWNIEDTEPMCSKAVLIADYLIKELEK